MKDETTLIDELKDRVHDLYDDNKSLQERLDTTLKTCNNLRDTIDKAIEYIERHKDLKYTGYLLAILRGKK